MNCRHCGSELIGPSYDRVLHFGYCHPCLEATEKLYTGFWTAERISEFTGVPTGRFVITEHASYRQADIGTDFRRVINGCVGLDEAAAVVKTLAEVNHGYVVFDGTIRYPHPIYAPENEYFLKSALEAILLRRQSKEKIH